MVGTLASQVKYHEGTSNFPKFFTTPKPALIFASCWGTKLSSISSVSSVLSQVHENKA